MTGTRPANLSPTSQWRALKHQQAQYRPEKSLESEARALHSNSRLRRKEAFGAAEILDQKPRLKHRQEMGQKSVRSEYFWREDNLRGMMAWARVYVNHVWCRGGRSHPPMHSDSDNRNTWGGGHIALAAQHWVTYVREQDTHIVCKQKLLFCMRLITINHLTTLIKTNNTKIALVQPVPWFRI